jgi:hypothetical protein
MALALWQMIVIVNSWVCVWVRVVGDHRPTFFWNSSNLLARRVRWLLRSFELATMALIWLAKRMYSAF